jgi:ubiquinone biosynthesis protein UbiJ
MAPAAGCWPASSSSIEPVGPGPVLQRFASDAALEGLNHLLRGQRQARELLRPLAGRTARIQAGPVALQFAIGPDGLLQSSPADPHVRIDIEAGSLAAGLSDPAAVLRDAHIRGDAELAQVLSRVAEQLRPDLEEDLSHWVGDAAAVRIVAALRAARHEVADAGERAARQLADYLAGERAWLASRGPFERFVAEVNELAQAAERLAERTSRLR